MKVRTLEWASEPPYSVARPFAGLHYATEVVWPPNGKSFDFVMLSGPTVGARRFASLSDAKSAAQDDFESRILSALSSSPVGEMDGWQTMDSAPKDGRNVLLCFHHHPVAIGRFEYGSWTYAFCVTEGGDSPTGWMPVPEKRRPNIAAEHTEGFPTSPQGVR